MKIDNIKKKLNPRVTKLIVFVLVFAGLGAWKIIDSYAATTPNPKVTFYNVMNLNPNDAKTVFPMSDTVAGVGIQNIINVRPKGKLIFTNYVLPATSICYFAKVYNSPKEAPPGTSASVTFVGKNNYKTVTLPDDNNYHEVCVQPSTKSQLSFNVENKSAYTDVFIYQAFAK